VEFRKHVLPNGLHVLAECNGGARSTALGYFVQTGARDETDTVSGVSHFLEHMAFKGTARRSADDVNREFDEMGAHYNAQTGEEHTIYYASVLPEHQSAALALLSDIMRPALRESDFDTEKQVILEEIRMYEDQPPFGAEDRCKLLHFGKHPLAKSILGTEASITALRVDAMRDYFRHRYGPENVMLVAAGRVDFDRLVSEAAEYCGSWEREPAGRDEPAAPAHRGFACVAKEGVTQEYAVGLANAPSATDDDRHAAKLLAMAIGDESGSRLYWDLVDPGDAEHAVLSHYDYAGSGMYGTYVSSSPENMGANLQRVLDIYGEAERKGITADELAQAKNKRCSRIVLASERPQGRLFRVGMHWLHRGTYRTVAQDVDDIERVTLADVSRVLERFPLTECTTVAIGPLSDIPAPK
jgi:predicted Zn-dependent peptidase